MASLPVGPPKTTLFWPCKPAGTISSSFSISSRRASVGKVDRVDELVGLLVDRLEDVWVRVADVEHADAREEIDVGVAVGVADRRALPLLEGDGDVVRIGDRATVDLALFLEQRPGVGAGDGVDVRCVIEMEFVYRRTCRHTRNGK